MKNLVYHIGIRTKAYEKSQSRHHRIEFEGEVQVQIVVLSSEHHKQIDQP